MTSAPPRTSAKLPITVATPLRFSAGVVLSSTAGPVSGPTISCANSYMASIACSGESGKPTATSLRPRASVTRAPLALESEREDQVAGSAARSG